MVGRDGDRLVLSPHPDLDRRLAALGDADGLASVADVVWDPGAVGELVLADDDGTIATIRATRDAVSVDSPELAASCPRLAEEPLRVLVDGMTAVNDLGLSDAVPGRVIVHSDARLNPVRLGNQVIMFRPTTTTKLYWAGRPAMRIVQALHWLRPKLEDPDEQRRVQRRLDALLSDQKHGRQLRNDLQAGFANLPLWMQAFLRGLRSMQDSARPRRSPRKSRKVRS